MAGKKKHAARSQRGFRNRIPIGIFYYHAAKRHEAKYQQGMATALSKLLSGSKEEE